MEAGIPAENLPSDGFPADRIVHLTLYGLRLARQIHCIAPCSIFCRIGRQGKQQCGQCRRDISFQMHLYPFPSPAFMAQTPPHSQ